MTDPKANPEIQILTAKDVSVPVFRTDFDVSPEIIKLRSDFLAGRELSREDIGKMLRASAEGGGNGNCNIC